MTEEIRALKEQAEKGRMLYHASKIEIAAAKEMIMPYLDAVNEHAKKLAKKYGMRPRKVYFSSYVR